jgi:glycosyltransferase involved in cell wall biosynthesis
MSVSESLPPTPPISESLSVVMPACNEAETIGDCIRRVLLEPRVTELIVIDDASVDGTSAVVEALMKSEPRIRLERHERNRGKGAALRTGFALAKEDLVLIQDADLEYDPCDYAAVLKPILQGRADVVFGSRFLGGGAHRVLYFWHYVGNKMLTLLSNCFTDLNLTDMETGMKAFRRSVAERIELKEDRFGFEPEFVAKVAALGVRIYEVPVSYHGRTYAEGKKASWRDGVSALRCIVKYRFTR